MLRNLSIPRYTNPLVATAALEMGLTLEDLGYSQHCRDLIIRHAQACGTLAGSAIDPEDEAVATEVFEGALEEIPFDSAAWDREDAFLDLDSLLYGRDGFDAAMEALEAQDPIPAEWPDEFPHVLPEPPDAPDAGRSWSDHYGELLATGKTSALPPVAGGSPEPFEPSAEDWACYCAWSRELDASGDFPREKDLEDRRRDRRDVLQWYTEHEGGDR
jgi:hypothetical protein